MVAFPKKKKENKERVLYMFSAIAVSNIRVNLI